MTTEVFDPWEAVDNFDPVSDVVVKDAVFAYHNELGTANAFLELHVDRYRDGVKVGSAEDGRAILYGCGEGWAVSDGGASVKRIDGAEKGFHKSTKYSRFAQSVIEVMPELRKSADPRLAKTWVGLNLTLERQKIGSFDGKDTFAELATSGKAVVKDAGSELDAGLREDLVTTAKEVKGNGGNHDQFLTLVEPLVSGNKVAKDAAFDDGADSIWANA